MGKTPKDVASGKPRRRRWGRIILLAKLGLFAVWAGIQLIGPWGPAPSEDPDVLTDRRYADLQPNAADRYAQALDLLTTPPDPNWPEEAGRSHLPLSPRLTTWIDDNQSFVDAFRSATQI